LENIYSDNITQLPTEMMKNHFVFFEVLIGLLFDEIIALCALVCCFVLKVLFILNEINAKFGSMGNPP
jgi:hypothetical protein